MSGKYGYVKIDKSNTELFDPPILDKGDYGIGITKKDKPCGTVILHKERDSLVVRSIRIDDPKEKNPEEELFVTLKSFAAKNGFKRIECRFADDEPNLTEDILRKAGFTEFKEDSLVFRIDAYSLGSLLRDGPYADMMYNECIRLLDEKRARCFSKVSNEVYENLSELYPDRDMSFMTVDESEQMESYIVISRLPDGSMYLSDMYCPSDKTSDLAALMFMSFGKVFMEIEPAGDFYISAVNEKYRRLADTLIAPLAETIDRQRIMTASMIL